MKYTKTGIIELLISKELIVPVSKGYLLAKRLKTLTDVKETTGFCKNYPKDFRGISDNVIYKKVIETCGIPTMFKKPGKSSYILHTSTTDSLMGLKIILQSSEIDYKRFVKVTSAYYKDPDLMVKSFANYIIEDVWEVLYNDKTVDKDEDYRRKGAI